METRNEIIRRQHTEMSQFLFDLNMRDVKAHDAMSLMFEINALFKRHEDEREAEFARRLKLAEQGIAA